MRQIEGYPLWLGHKGDAADFERLFRLGIGAVIDLALNEPATLLPREIAYCRFPLVDGAGNPPWLLRSAAQTVATFLRAGVPTLLFCGAGLSRSPAIAAAGLAILERKSLKDALADIARGGAVDVSTALWTDLEEVIRAAD
jgi:hypothetical protein